MSSNRKKRKKEGRNAKGLSNKNVKQSCFHQSTVDYKTSSFFKEYEMVRTEILQYLKEYQSVRNMMYLATATILSVNSFMFQSYYLCLLPLIIILPSYMIFYNYWKAVSYASTYIQVFLDDDTVQTTYHWELRLRYFGELLKKPRGGDKLRDLNMHSHQLPYWLCSYLCLALYWINMLWKCASPYIHETVGETWVILFNVFKTHFFNFEGYCLISTWHDVGVKNPSIVP